MGFRSWLGQEEKGLWVQGEVPEAWGVLPQCGPIRIPTPGLRNGSLMCLHDLLVAVTFLQRGQLKDYTPWCTDKETEARRGEVTEPSSHSWSVTHLEAGQAFGLLGNMVISPMALVRPAGFRHRVGLPSTLSLFDTED